MKAITLKVFGGTENFELQHINNPSLTTAGVRIKIKSTAFNPIDYQMRRGGAESKLLKSVVLGREMAGVVTEVERSVQNFRVSDEVFAYVSNLGSNGTYAEEIVVPEAILAHKPHNLTFNQAAAIPLVGLTALQTIEKCSLRANDNVFIAGGAGGVGSMIIRLLMLDGINRIFTTAGSRESTERLINLGIKKENVFDYRNNDLINELRQATGDDQMDCCVDTVGNQLSDLCAEIVKVNGKYADVAFLATSNARELLFDKGVTVFNISNYAYGLERDLRKMQYYGKNLALLKQKLESGALEPTPVTVVGNLSVETVAKAHRLLEENQTRGQKLVMEVG